MLQVWLLHQVRSGGPEGPVESPEGPIKCPEGPIKCCYKVDEARNPKKKKKAKPSTMLG